MHRLAIFLDDPSAVVPVLLARETLRAARRRSDIEVVAVCVRKPKAYHRLLHRHVLGLLRRRIGLLTGRKPQRTVAPPAPLNLPRLARQYGFRVLSPPSANCNHPSFVAELENVVRPTMAFSFFCGQRFRDRLLKALQYAVNYHDGALPEYRGVSATSWSLYHGENESGFTFHLMESRLDQGPVLLEGSVPIRPDSSLWDLEWEKAVMASACLPRLLEMMVNRAPGTPQQGSARFFPEKEARQIRTIVNPAELSSAEIIRRLRAFGSLFVRSGAKWYRIGEIKQMDRADTKKKRPWFQSSDGTIWQPTRYESAQPQQEL